MQETQLHTKGRHLKMFYSIYTYGIVLKITPLSGKIVNSTTEVFERTCCIQDNHIYKEVWETAVGEELEREIEPHSSLNRCVVAVG